MPSQLPSNGTPAVFTAVAAIRAWVIEQAMLVLTELTNAVAVGARGMGEPEATAGSVE
jgi:hypothetical protein